jgi:hypothetical protein
MRLLPSTLLQLLAASVLTGLPFARAVPTLDPPPALAYVPAAGGRGPAQDVIQPADVELFPLLLVSTLSGGLHALDRDTGEEVWGIPPALPPASAEHPSGAQARPAGLNVEPPDDERLTEKFLVDPREGMVYLATKEASQWQLNKLGVTVPDLCVTASTVSADEPSADDDPSAAPRNPTVSKHHSSRRRSTLLRIPIRPGSLSAPSRRPFSRSTCAPERSSTPSTPPAPNRPPEPRPGLAALTWMTSWTTSRVPTVMFLSDRSSGSLGPVRSGHGSSRCDATRSTNESACVADYTLRVHTPSIPPSPPQTLFYTTFAPRSSSTQHPASVFSLPHSLDSQYHQLAVTPAKTGLACLKETSSGTLVMLWGLEFESDFPIGLWDVFVLRETGGLFVGRQVNPRRSLIVDQHGQVVKSGGGVLVTRGGGPGGDELLALSTDSYPFLGIVGALPSPSVGKLEGWHPGVLAPNLNESERETSREVWDAQLGEGMARVVERRMIEAGAADENSNSLEDATGPAALEPRRSRFGKWLSLALLGSALPLFVFRARRAGVKRRTLSTSTEFEDRAEPASAARDPPIDFNKRPDTRPAEKVVPATANRETLAKTGSASPVGEADPDGKKKKRRQRRKGKKDDEAETEPADDPDLPVTISLPASASVSALSTPTLPALESSAALGAIVATPPLTSPTPPMPEALTISDELLGTGSHGTLVFRGTFQSRPVAVKRLLSHFTSLHSREISLLQSSDHHPNIVRYFYQEHREPWLLIALELCPCSLGELVERGPRGDEAIWAEWKGREEEALKGAVQGVEHLHSLKICHRDIKPQCVLWPCSQLAPADAEHDSGPAGISSSLEPSPAQSVCSSPTSASRSSRRSISRPSARRFTRPRPLATSPRARPAGARPSFCSSRRATLPKGPPAGKSSAKTVAAEVAPANSLVARQD